MGPTMTNHDMSPEARQRAQEGVEHFQAAARALIEAARAALDVAEEWVDDPDAIASLARTLAVVGDVARRVSGTGGWARPQHTPSARPSPPSEDEPRVQRITVT